MEAKHYLYIVPGYTEMASQCRIYRRENVSGEFDPARNYRIEPQKWVEVGLMNSRGALVCFDGPPVQRLELLDCQPLMADMAFSFVVEKEEPRVKGQQLEIAALL